MFTLVPKKQLTPSPPPLSTLPTVSIYAGIPPKLFTVDLHTKFKPLLFLGIICGIIPKNAVICSTHVVKVRTAYFIQLYVVIYQD